MQFDRRTILKIIGSIPLFGWIDPIRSVAHSDTAIHYRLKKDGRSIFKLLRDSLRNGIHHSDLERILGPFKLIGPVERLYTMTDAPGYPDFPNIDLDKDHIYIEYPMSYAFVLLELKEGRLFNHDPRNFNDYPDGFTYQGGRLEAISRPLDEGPMKNPPPTYNDNFDS